MKNKFNKRKINGILLLDKPIGLTSNAALQEIKYLYFAQKAGHTGSLDPLATGMLPICFGEATKFSQYLLDSDKSYTVKAKLGERTTTSDAEGEIVSTREVPTLSQKQIDKVLDQFRGEIKQIPSMFSALKYQGRPLYQYAREGIEIPREARPVTVYQLTLTDYEDPVVTLTMRVSKGTYVRTIVDDLGELLGCGAHVIELRRTSVCGFAENEMITLDQIEQMKEEKHFQAMDDLLMPPEIAVAHWPEVNVGANLEFYLRQGSPVLIPNLPDECQWLRLASQQGAFIGIGERLDDGRVAPRRLIN